MSGCKFGLTNGFFYVFYSYLARPIAPRSASAAAVPGMCSICLLTYNWYSVFRYTPVLGGWRTGHINPYQ